MTDFLHFVFPGLPVSKEKQIAREIIAELKGGLGSGNFGHAGRPGEVGGSAAGGNDKQNNSPFKVSPIHHKDYGTRKWKLPSNGIVTLYHDTGADPKSILEKGILAGENYDVYARQAPTEGGTRKYTIEFDANLNKGDMYPAGGYNSPLMYEHPMENTYFSDFTWHGVWTSGGKDIDPSKIRLIYDNDAKKVVYQR